MSPYQFSSPIRPNQRMKIGADVRVGWPEQGRRLNYKYTGLGALGDPRLGKQYKYTGLERADYHYTGLGTDAAPTQPVQISPDMLARFSSQASGAMSVISTIQGIVSALAGIAQGIIGAVQGIDPNTRNVANTIINWIRQIVMGQPLSAVTFSPGEVNSMADYCTNVRPIVEGAVQAAIGVGIGIASGQRNAGAINALNTIQTVLIGGPSGGGGIANFVCTIPQVQAAIAAAQTASTPDCAGQIPNSTWDVGAGTCMCLPGYSSAIRPGQCLPDNSTQPTRFLNPVTARILTSSHPAINMQACPDGSFIPSGGQCPSTQAPSSGPSPLLIGGVIAAIAGGAYLYSKRNA